jgi:hypothetical protein
MATNGFKINYLLNLIPYNLIIEEAILNIDVIIP